MWDPNLTDPQPSFLVAVAAPSTQPADSPTVCVPINVAWLPYVIGALYQLVLPTTWDGVGVSVAEMQARATDLIDLFVRAVPCTEIALSSRLVMADLPSAPPIPLWNETGTDWIYEG